MPSVSLEFARIEKECSVPIQEARVGGNVSILCPARGVPPVEWMWSRSEEMVDIGGRVSLVNGGERLNISLLQEDDGGVYTCSVSNTIEGETFRDSYNIRLDVQSKCPYINIYCSLHLPPTFFRTPLLY